MRFAPVAPVDSHASPIVVTGLSTFKSAIEKDQHIDTLLSIQAKVC